MHCSTQIVYLSLAFDPVPFTSKMGCGFASLPLVLLSFCFHAFGVDEVVLCVSLILVFYQKIYCNLLIFVEIAMLK